MEFLILVPICIIIGVALTLYVLHKKEPLELDIFKKNNLEQELANLQRVHQKTLTDLAVLNKEIEQKRAHIEELYNAAEHQKQQRLEDLNRFSEDRLEEISIFVETVLENRKKEVSAALEAYANMNKAEKDAALEALQIRLDEAYTEEEQIYKVIEELRKVQNVALEKTKEEYQAKIQGDFFRLVLSKSDLEDVLNLKSIERLLHNKEVLNKLIYKTYYEKPYTNLIGRVIGGKSITGIYKITNLENGLIYIGQAVNIADRWKQHIRRGLGADPLTQNKLYPAMQETGVHNFSFEVLEECEKSALSEKEKFWIEFYDSKTFGYNMKT